MVKRTTKDAAPVADAGSEPAAAPAPETATAQAEGDGAEPSADDDQPAPPAPGEDAQSVFDRRIDRLHRIVDEAEFETGTVFGDFRDTLLDLFKHRPKVWSAMSHDEQQSVARAIEALGKRLIARVVLLVAQDDSDVVQGTLDKKWTVNGESLEAKVKIDNADNDTLADLFKLAGHRVVIVSADDKRFMSARRDVEIEPDQLGMKFAGDAQPGPTADAEPVAEPDLADGADATSGVDKAKAAAVEGGEFGVFDTVLSSWLTGGDAPEEWTDDREQAGRFTHEEATGHASEFADENNAERIVVRNLAA